MENNEKELVRLMNREIELERKFDNSEKLRKLSQERVKHLELLVDLLIKELVRLKPEL